HHCRNCGKVVCHKCSSYRWMLPYQGSSRVRICSECHSELQTQSQQLMNRTIENEPPGPAAEPETGSEAAASVTEPSESPEASKRSTRFFTQNEPTAEDPVQEPIRPRKGATAEQSLFATNAFDITSTAPTSRRKWSLIFVLDPRMEPVKVVSKSTTRTN
ncbi:FYVE RhoGEF and PH domain-containing protein 6, partial [Clonorchis sinensis]